MQRRHVTVCVLPIRNERTLDGTSIATRQTDLLKSSYYMGRKLKRASDEKIRYTETTEGRDMRVECAKRPTKLCAREAESRASGVLGKVYLTAD